MNDGYELSPISDVPEDAVGDVVQSFINNDDVTEVVVVKQSDGDYTIQAYE